ANGDIDGDGDYDQIYSYGARSFSIWDNRGNQIYDSGNDFDLNIAAEYPLYFNSTNDDNDSFDNRSDDKASEPEAIEVIDLDTAKYAFIGLERMGGIMVYRVDDPANPEFVEYELNRNFDFDADTSLAGDLAPEDIIYIDTASSPNGKALIVVANEVSGTITIYQLFEEAQSVGVKRDLFARNSIKVYPNPVSGSELRFTERGNYEIFNMMGQKVAEITRGDSLDVSGFESGLYIIKSDENRYGRFLRR
ncbi:MAG: T9SS type A sorting domain-containing protein, partial [Bacteroidota bacterium]